jgi:hypothetical protein
MESLVKWRVISFGVAGNEGVAGWARKFWRYRAKRAFLEV